MNVLSTITGNPLHLLGGAAIAVAIGFGGGWMVNGWRLNTDIAEIKTAHAQEVAKQAAATVTQMQADAAAIHTAATEFAAIQNTLGPKFDALTKGIKNAPHPLPVDCVPDAYRVRNLREAINAANAAIAGQ